MRIIDNKNNEDKNNKNNRNNGNNRNKKNEKIIEMIEIFFKSFMCCRNLLKNILINLLNEQIIKYHRISPICNKYIVQNNKHARSSSTI